MTRHKLVAANITLQIGPSVAVSVSVSVDSNPTEAWHGRERKRCSRYLWHCGAVSRLPQMNGVHVGTAEERIGTVRLPLHREERETTRGRTIAECDCAFLVHPATKKYMYVRRACGSRAARGCGRECMGWLG